MHRRGMLVGVCLLFLCFTTQPTGADPTGWLESFQSQLAALAERSRQQKEPEQGLAEATRLLQRLVDEVAGGQQACVLFARVELLRAIFEAKLQRWEDAVWDYAVALNLDPEVAKFSFNDYPELAPRFAAERDRLLGRFENLRASEKQQPRTEPQEPSVCGSPKRIASKEASYPRGARKGRRETSVRFAIVIDKTGAPAELFWENDCDLAPFFVAAAEAARSWRWEPIVCEAEGSPAEAVSVVEVHFELR